MSTETPGTPAPPAPAQPPAPITPPAPAAEETDWKAEARKWEDRAKENKAAADKLAELEEASKTDQQRQAEALAAAQRERDEAQAAVLRHSVAEAKKVPASLLKGSTKEEMEAHADQLLEFQGASGARPPAPSPLQGAGGNPHPATEADQFAAFLKTQLS